MNMPDWFTTTLAILASIAMVLLIIVLALKLWHYLKSIPRSQELTIKNQNNENGDGNGNGESEYPPIIEYWSRFYIVAAGVYLILLLVNTILWASEVKFLGLNLGTLFFWVLMAYTIGSFRVVKPNEVGGLILLGYPIGVTKRGLHFIPLILSTFPWITLNIVQRELPGEPEDIWHGNPNERPTEMIIGPHGELVPRFVLPDRIPTGYPKDGMKKEKENEGEDVAPNRPLNIQATVEPQTYVRFQIQADYFLQQFYVNIGDLAQAVTDIHDTIVGVLQKEFRKRTVEKIIDDIDEINQQLREDVRTLVITWGIELRDVYIKTVGLSHDLNSALMAVGIQKAEAMSKIIAAEAEKMRLIEEGTGRAKARELALLAEGEGLAGIAQALGISQEEMMELVRTEAAKRAIIEAENLTIFNGNSMNGLPGIFGLADALKDQGGGR